MTGRAGRWPREIPRCAQNDSDGWSLCNLNLRREVTNGEQES